MGANVSTRSPTSDSQEYSSADALEPIGNTIRAASVMHCWDHQNLDVGQLSQDVT